MDGAAAPETTGIATGAFKDAPVRGGNPSRRFGVGPVSYTHLDVYKRQLQAYVWYFWQIYVTDNSIVKFVLQTQLTNVLKAVQNLQGLLRDINFDAPHTLLQFS